MLTGTLVKRHLAVSVPPTPPPLTVAVWFKLPPGPTGTQVMVTGTASELSPALPSDSSAMSASSVTEAAVPPGELTGAAKGLDGEGVTVASSRLISSVLEPLLGSTPDLELVNSARIEWLP